MRRRNQGKDFGKGVKCSVKVQQQPTPPPAWPGRAVPEPPRQSWDGPKPISIVGSTGSIGTQVLYPFLAFFVSLADDFSSIAWIRDIVLQFLSEIRV